jgi:hypothetical protein
VTGENMPGWNVSVHSPPPDLTSGTCPILSLMAKQVTGAGGERKKEQAAAFTERIGEPDRASDFDDMSVDEYVERRGLQITNPRRRASGCVKIAASTDAHRHTLYGARATVSVLHLNCC